MKYILPLLLAALTVASAQTVRFDTNLGNIDVELLPNDAPQTVANFLRYVNRGAYTNSFFHRSVPGFVIQGGGYTFVNNTPREIPADPPVRNEFKISNTRGTIAMAKLGNDPNSATSQWFFNLTNNSSNLDRTNGGFTVFGRITDAAGLAVMDRIAGLTPYPVNNIFTELPLQNLSSNQTTITANNLVMIRSITVLSTPTIRAEDGVRTAGGYGGGGVTAPGSYIEIFGSNFAETTRTWNESDFAESRAPTSLDNVSVTVGGKAAFIYYISPDQINAQVPGDLAPGSGVPVVVTYNGKSSEPFNVEIKERAGGLLALATFNIGDKQYVSAVHNTVPLSYVANGSIPDIPEAPAAAGETLIFYGVGFGPVTPNVQPGEIARSATAVMNRVEFFFGERAANVTYAGLSPDSVGLYQFNVEVPQGLTPGDVRLRVLSGGEEIAQSLWIPVQ